MVVQRALDKYKSFPVQVRASFWSLVCGVLQRGISVIVTPIFTRLMSTSEYGQFVTFQSWLELLGLFLTLRLYYGVFTQGLVRRAEGDEDTYTSALIGLMTALELVGLAVYLPFRGFWNSLTDLNTLQMICIFIVSWASGLFAFWTSRQRIEYRYRALVGVTLAFAIAQPSCGVAAVLAYPATKVDARVVSMACVQLVAFTWIFFMYMSRGKKPYVRKYWRHALSFNLPLVPHYLSATLLNHSDRIMINNMISASAAGIYGLSYSLSFIMTVVNQAVLNTLSPWMYKRIRAGESAKIARISYMAIGLVAMVNLAVVAVAPEVVAIFAPPAYAEATSLVPPLAASVVVTFLYSLFANFEFYYERTNLVMAASLVGAAVNVGLNWLLLPVFGYQVAAWTTLLGYLVYVGMHYVFMRRVQIEEMNGERVYNLRVIVSVLLAFACAAALLVVLYPWPIVRYALCVIALVMAILKRNQFTEVWHQLRG